VYAESNASSLYGGKGAVMWSIASPLFDTAGDIIGAIESIRDITERKQAEETLIKSEEKFRKVFYTSLDAMNINLLENGNYISINPGFTKIMGYTEQDIAEDISIKDKVWDSIDDRQRLIAGLRKDGEVIDFEATFRTKNNDLRYGLLSASVVDLDGVPHILSVTRDITELKETFEKLKRAVETTIQVVVTTVEARDPYTAGHQIRVAELARAIAEEMKLPPRQIDGIFRAASIHDIGKLSIPAEILTKPTALTNTEFSLMKEHPQKGYDILKDVESDWPLAEIVWQHHERMDGSGYPRGLKGDEILIEARILAVADVVEAMASHRPYRPSLGIEAALDEIAKNRGTLYDSDVVDICLKLFQEKGYTLS